MIECIRCGEKNADGRKRCRRCGAALPVNLVGGAAAAPTKPQLPKEDPVDYSGRGGATLVHRTDNNGRKTRLRSKPPEVPFSLDEEDDVFTSADMPEGMPGRHEDAPKGDDNRDDGDGPAQDSLPLAPNPPRIPPIRPGAAPSAAPNNKKAAAGAKKSPQVTYIPGKGIVPVGGKKKKLPPSSSPTPPSTPTGVARASLNNDPHQTAKTPILSKSPKNPSSSGNTRKVPPPVPRAARQSDSPRDPKPALERPAGAAAADGRLAPHVKTPIMTPRILKKPQATNAPSAVPPGPTSRPKASLTAARKARPVTTVTNGSAPPGPLTQPALKPVRRPSPVIDAEPTQVSAAPVNPNKDGKGPDLADIARFGSIFTGGAAATDDNDEQDRTRPFNSFASNAEQTRTEVEAIMPTVVCLERLDPDGTIHTSRKLKPGRFIIGREDGDILLNHDTAVSPWHAQLVVRRNGVFLKDMNARNRVHVRIRKETPLEHGDSILLGATRLIFNNRWDAPSTPHHDDDTVAMGTEGYDDPARLLLVRAGGHTVAVHFIGQSLTLGSELFGKDARIDGQHARIERTEKGFVLTDLGSKEGTFIAIRQEIELKDGETFQVGRTRFRLTL